MSYIHCPHCDQKALSVATRCPRCGTAFERQTVPVPKPRRFPPGLAVAGVLVLLLVAIAVRLDVGVAPPPPGLTSGLTPPPRPSPTQPTPPAPVESVPTVRAPAESVAIAAVHPAETARVVTPVPTPPPTPVELPRAAAPAADSARSDATQRRYASTWLNVRAQRSSKAAIVRVLRPGELVLVGTQQQGWYPIMEQERTAGFVDRRLLDTSPPISP